MIKVQNSNWFRVFALGLLLCGCELYNQDDDNIPGVEKTGNVITLSGRVIGESSEPISGVKVKLKNQLLSDVTDSDGRYRIEGSVEPLAKTSGKTRDDLDVLLFIQGNEKVAEFSITEWVDDLPDVQLIQRDFSGSINALEDVNYRVEAVLMGEETDGEILLTKEFFYNSTVSEYSGYLFFNNSSDLNSYHIYINVYDEDDELVGVSDTVAFNDNAGDVTIPSITLVTQSIMVRAQIDSGLGLFVDSGDTVYLEGSVYNEFGLPIEKMEWKVGDGDFEETEDGLYTFIADKECCEGLVLIFRVTDTHGNVFTDTLVMGETADLPDDGLGVPNIKNVFIYSGPMTRDETEGYFELLDDLESLLVEYGIGIVGFSRLSASNTFEDFDVVIYYPFSEMIIEDYSGNEDQGLKEYIENGGAWLGIYRAGDHEQVWPWYEGTLLSGATMEQAQSRSITLLKDGDVTSDAALNKMWEESQNMDSQEWNGNVLEFTQGSHFDLRNDPDVKVIHTVDPEDEAYPDEIVTWTKNIGQGRALYTALGTEVGGDANSREWFAQMLWHYMNYLVGNYDQ